MKYQYIYKQSKNKEEFIEKVLNTFSVKKKTAERVWYKLKNKNNKIETYATEEMREKLFPEKEPIEVVLELIKMINEKVSNLPVVKVASAAVETLEQIEKPREVNYLPDEKTELNHRKMLIFQDLKIHLKRQNREYLKKYGLTDMEINWLEDERMV